MRLEGRVGVAVPAAELTPVDHRGDSCLRGAEQPDQRGGVDVVGRAMGSVRSGMSSNGRVAEAAEQRLPDVPVGVHEPRHDDGVPSVDQLGVTGPHPRADLGDRVAVDQHVGLVVVADRGVHAENAAILDQSSRHVTAPPLQRSLRRLTSHASLPRPLSPERTRCPISVTTHGQSDRTVLARDCGITWLDWLDLDSGIKRCWTMDHRRRPPVPDRKIIAVAPARARVTGATTEGQRHHI